MKIRTVTYFIDSDIQHLEGGIKNAALMLPRIGELLKEYEVQTIRAACRPDMLYGENISVFRDLNSICGENGIDFFSCGFSSDPNNMKHIPEFISETERLFMSTACISKGTVSEEAVNASAKIILELADVENGNLRFCAGASIKPNTPFFPASFAGNEGFAIGLEAGDVLLEAFSSDADDKLALFREMFSVHVERINLLMSGIKGYFGIDTSMAPGIEPSASVAEAYKAYLNAPFGSRGTKELTGKVNAILKSFEGHQGYSGLMFPVMEDTGLAGGMENYTINDLIDYSTACGCGLDTIPVPGTATVEQIAYLIKRTAVNALTFNKPLSVRVMPVKGRRAGEIALSSSPYLIDCRIFALP